MLHGGSCRQAGCYGSEHAPGRMVVRLLLSRMLKTAVELCSWPSPAVELCSWPAWQELRSWPAYLYNQQQPNDITSGTVHVCGAVVASLHVTRFEFLPVALMIRPVKQSWPETVAFASAVILSGRRAMQMFSPVTCFGFCDSRVHQCLGHT